MTYKRDGQVVCNQTSKDVAKYAVIGKDSGRLLGFFCETCTNRLLGDPKDLKIRQKLEITPEENISILISLYLAEHPEFEFDQWPEEMGI